MANIAFAIPAVPTPGKPLHSSLTPPEMHLRCHTSTAWESVACEGKTRPNCCPSMSSRQILPKCGQQQQTPASALEIRKRTASCVSCCDGKIRCSSPLQAEMKQPEPVCRKRSTSGVPILGHCRATVNRLACNIKRVRDPSLLIFSACEWHTPTLELRS